MSMLTASSCATSPLQSLGRVKTDGQCSGHIKHAGSNPLRLSVQFQPCDGRKEQTKLSKFGPVGHGTQLQHIERRKTLLHSFQMRSASVICASALNARCGAEQTQTITREAPTITQAPIHENQKSPELDDGGTGFPPRDDGDGGGGGGGGGGNWSGGFFFFGFLAFLGFLKDKEGEGDYRDSRRR